MAAGRADVPPGEQTILVPRPSGLMPWVLEILPLRPESRGHFDGLAGAVVLVTDADAKRLPSERLLSQLYGLTPAEASLASSLVAGVSVAEHAALRGVSLSTVRTQVASILGKTGTRRQAELVSRLALALP